MKLDWQPVKTETTEPSPTLYRANILGIEAFVRMYCEGSWLLSCSRLGLANVPIHGLNRDEACTEAEKQLKRIIDDDLAKLGEISRALS